VTHPPSPEAFYGSAQKFAGSALQAHHDGDYRRVAVDAGTALEHLLKAVLAKRSPALLSDLKGMASYYALLELLEIPSTRPSGPLSTVGLRGALDRVKVLVSSRASEADLLTLVGMRDGTIHAALDDKVEERLLVAFVQHADALLADLECDRDEF
jgi:hypothetical protein